MLDSDVEYGPPPKVFGALSKALRSLALPRTVPHLKRGNKNRNRTPRVEVQMAI
jgi:hypothetical protein